MRRALFIIVGALLTVGVGCAGPNQVVWPDESARIDQDMAPPPAGEPIPEGIALGRDAPPLAKEPYSAPQIGAIGGYGYGGYGTSGYGYGSLNNDFAPGFGVGFPGTFGQQNLFTQSPFSVPPPVPHAPPAAPPPGGSVPGLLP